MSGSRLALAALAAALLAAGEARAHDHWNLEEGLPVRVEDAFPVGFRGREVQMVNRYNRTHDGGNQYLFEPRVEFGFAPNLQARLSAPFLVGAEREGSGNVALELFYNFNMETSWLPAFTLTARGEAPTGFGSDGFDTLVKVILTKTLPFTSHLQRLHLNANWYRNDSARPGERVHRYAVTLGYEVRTSASTMLVADLFREQQLREGRASNVGELGLRAMVTPLMTVSVGAGVGLGDRSPWVRATLGLQYAL